MVKYFLLVLLFGLFFNDALAWDTSGITPPDSNTTIVDKTAAAYLIEEGKTLYFEGKVKDALIKFRQASLKDPLAWKAPYWISQCHYAMNNYGYALKYANEAVFLNGNEIDKEVYDLLADSYHRLGIMDTAIMNYELAIQHLSKNRVKELELNLRLAQAKYAKEQLELGVSPLRVRVEGLVNSGYDDYGARLYNGGMGMYFTSRRSNTTGGGQNPSDQKFFEDVYSAKWNPESNQWDSITNRIGKLNGFGFESISYVSEDGMFALITLNNSAAPDEKVETQSSDIAEIKWTTQGRWSSPKLIANKSVNTSFFDGAATMTADGNTMYFVSEQKGAKSKSDIYMVEKVGNNWGKAVRLPEAINTAGRESTPYITPNGRYLFFSSNGHENGMGGYDIYVVERQGSEWGEVKNLGPAINTVNDDFHFTFYEPTNTAYVSGLELIGDKASIDMYEIKITLEELLKNAK